MRYTRPLSVCSETRLRPSFLRTTPARKPRTECRCQSVAAMIAAIVAPAGVRSIAMMRACLVLGRVGDLDAASTDCSRDLGLLAFRAGKRASDPRCQDSAILLSPLSVHSSTRSRDIVRLVTTFRINQRRNSTPRIQGDDFKDERIFASNSVRILRAASA